MPSDIADGFAPPLFGFLRIAPHRVGFGENANWPVFAAGFDHDKRFSFRGVENGDGFLNVHAGMQHDVPMMKNVDKAARLLDIRRVLLNDLSLQAGTRQAIMTSRTMNPDFIVSFFYGPANFLEGSEKSLVLYWYQTQKRVIANEYKAKLLTVEDAIRYNRTDTALVRVVVPVRGSNDAEAQQEAVAFVQSFFIPLRKYLPS